jgi:MoaA/NifB/PqqE/SkfB family radical SAM enzyme
MCNIWQNASEEEMEPGHYEKLPTSLRTMNITGGEPFLRKDLVKVVSSIHKRAPHARMVFSTNGLLTDTIVSVLSEVREFHPRVGVGVSIDGLESTHDDLRGIEGIFKSAVATIESLKGIGITDLRMGMTFLQNNVQEAKDVFNLSKRLGVQFTATFAHNSEIYFQKTDNPLPESSGSSQDALEAVVKAELRSGSPKDWFRAYHMMGVMDPELRGEFISHCEAGARFFFMSPSGNVFPCSVMNMLIGNLRCVETWDDIFKDDVETRVTRSVRGCRNDCWMVCNTRSLIITHPLKAAHWVLRHKAGAHIRG